MAELEQLCNHVERCVQTINSFPTLKQLALDKIAITLWEKRIPEFSQNRSNQEIKSIKHSILDFTQTLGIPRIINRELQYTIAEKRDRLIDFFEDLTEFEFLEISRIFWTPHGKIDKQKTVGHYLKSGIVKNDYWRLKLAYNFCVEDEMVRLWEEKEMLIEKWSSDNFIYFPCVPFVYHYWNSFVAGEVMSDENLRDLLFLAGDSISNATAEYFGRKIGNGNRESFLWWCRSFGNKDLYFHFLSNSTTEVVLEEIVHDVTDVYWTLMFLSRNLHEYELTQRLLDFMDEEMRSEVFRGKLI